MAVRTFLLAALAVIFIAGTDAAWTYDGFRNSTTCQAVNPQVFQAIFPYPETPGVPQCPGANCNTTAIAGLSVGTACQHAGSGFIIANSTGDYFIVAQHNGALCLGDHIAGLAAQTGTCIPLTGLFNITAYGRAICDPIPAGQESANATWTAYSDPDCTQAIPSLTPARLSPGGCTQITVTTTFSFTGRCLNMRPSQPNVAIPKATATTTTRPGGARKTAVPVLAGVAAVAVAAML